MSSSMLQGWSFAEFTPRLMKAHTQLECSQWLIRMNFLAVTTRPGRKNTIGSSSLPKRTGYTLGGRWKELVTRNSAELAVLTNEFLERFRKSLHGNWSQEYFAATSAPWHRC